jgi:myo-inositol-1(or 4)-monophosphatase
LSEAKIDRRSLEKDVSSEDQETLRRYLALQGLGLEASALAMRYFEDQASLGTSMKGAQDWLTEADSAVETLLRARIAEAFPIIQ